MDIKDEIIKKGLQCKSKEELLALAKEKGVALDEAEVTELFESMKIKTGKLSDDELDSVAGGDTRQGRFGHDGLCPKCARNADYCICICPNCGSQMGKCYCLCPRCGLRYALCNCK